MQARLYSFNVDTAVIVVWRATPPRDTTPGEALSYLDTVVRHDGEWVSVGPRRAFPLVLPKPNSTPTKLAPPPPANRVSRP